MGFKDAWEFEKKNMPDFQWRHEKFLLAYLIVLGGGTVLSLGIGLLLEFAFRCDGPVCMIPYFIYAAAVVGMTVALVVRSKRVKKLLYDYHLEKLSQKYYDVDYSQAMQNLIDARKITDLGFLLDELLPFPRNDVLPFEYSQITFVPRFWGGKLFMSFVVSQRGRPLLGDEVDNDYYNFFRCNLHLFTNKRLFKLFCDDKSKFLTMLLRYNDGDKILKKM